MADLDIAAFLRDRYDEAFAAADSSPDVGRYDEVELQAKFDMPGYHAEYYASVPASLRRAEITANRQIIELHDGEHECREMHEGTYAADWPSSAPYGSPGAAWRHASEEYFEAATPCPTLRLLALPYVGHPDYREEWRP